MNDLLPNLLHPEDAWAACLIIGGVIGGLAVLGRIVLHSVHSSGKSGLPSKEYQRILIPIIDQIQDDIGPAIDLATRLAASSHTILLIYFLPIPRSRSLATILPEEEHETKHVLEAIASRVQATRLHPTYQTRRCRSTWDEIRRTLEEEHIDLMIFLALDQNAPIDTSWPMDVPCDILSHSEIKK